MSAHERPGRVRRLVHPSHRGGAECRRRKNRGLLLWAWTGARKNRLGGWASAPDRESTERPSYGGAVRVATGYKMKDEKPTHLDLFSGIGGFSIAFESEGFRTVAFSEIAPAACIILRRRWPDVPNLGDIATADLSKFRGGVDVITSGDPCQENSGARQGVDTTSPSLGREFISAVDVVRPRVVLRENPSAVRPDAPWPWWRIREHLEAMGYVAVPVRMRSCCLGAEHQRERMFVLANLPDALRPRSQGDEQQIVARARELKSFCDTARQNRRHATPRICGSTDALPGKSHRLKHLGNAVDPEVARIFARAIKLFL
jgi:DNA (cytosine-5)-methyltransferase 1